MDALRENTFPPPFPGSSSLQSTSPPLLVITMGHTQPLRWGNGQCKWGGCSLYTAVSLCRFILLTLPLLQCDSTWAAGSICSAMEYLLFLLLLWPWWYQLCPVAPALSPQRSPLQPTTTKTLPFIPNAQGMTFSVTKWRDTVPSKAAVVFHRCFAPSAEWPDHYVGEESHQRVMREKGNHPETAGTWAIGKRQSRQISSGLGEWVVAETSRRDLSNLSRPLISHFVSLFHSLVPVRNAFFRFRKSRWARDCWSGLQKRLQAPLSTGPSWRFLSYREEPKTLHKNSPCWHNCTWSRTAVQKGINAWSIVISAERHKVQHNWMNFTCS